MNSTERHCMVDVLEKMYVNQKNFLRFPITSGVAADSGVCIVQLQRKNDYPMVWDYRIS